MSSINFATATTPADPEPIVAIEVIAHGKGWMKAAVTRPSDSEERTAMAVFFRMEEVVEITPSIHEIGWVDIHLAYGAKTRAFKRVSFAPRKPDLLIG